jgi:hypothetical protein
MNLPDFDKAFSDYFFKWMEANRDNYEYLDQMEQDMPAVYEEFLDTPQDFIGGQKPGEFFENYSDTEMLVDWARAYLDEGIDLPDMLLNRICDLGDAQALYPCLESGERDEMRMAAVTLLREMDDKTKAKEYIIWQSAPYIPKELKDNALESLEEMGEEVRPLMLSYLDQADDEGKESLLSVLCGFGKDDRVYEGLIDLFERKKEKRAALSAYLGKLGDERAVPVLEKAAASVETPYLDYIEMRSAIEQLGGEAPERDFDEDEIYDRFMRQ